MGDAGGGPQKRLVDLLATWLVMKESAYLGTVCLPVDVAST